MALAVVGIGVLALAGWIFDVRWLASFGPDGAQSMKVNASICMILLGSALWARVAGHGRAAVALAAVPVGIALMAFAEEVLGTNLGIDELIAEDIHDEGTTSPGRMGPYAALAVTATGIAIATWGARIGRINVSSICALLIGAVGLLGVVGYATGTRGLVSAGTGSVTDYALPGALAGLLLSGGILAGTADRGTMALIAGSGPGGSLLRRLLPIVLIAPILLAAGMFAAANNGVLEDRAAAWALLVLLICLLGFAIIRLAKLLDVAEEERRSNREREGNFFALAVDMLATVDRDGRLADLNPAWRRNLGLDPEGLTGARLLDLVAPDQRPGLDRAMMRAWRRGHAEVECRFRADVEEWRRIAIGMRLSDELGLLFMRGTDVTDAREAAEELAHSNADLERFAYVVSHDLSEPLRTVGGFAQLVSRQYRDSIDDRGREFIDHIISGTERMSRMIDDLLEYSRASGRELQREPVDLNGLVESVRRDLSAMLERTGGLIEAGELPTVWGDAVRVRQVFQNLLTNALKFNRPGVTPWVGVGAEKVGNYWRIEVVDNGIGVEPEFAERVFLPFQRLHAAGEYEGTGIGLAICQKVVEGHGGRIWLEPGPDGGTRIQFFLPAVPANRAEARAVDPSGRAPAPATAGAPVPASEMAVIR